MAKGYRKKQLEEAYHLSIGRILYYLYWTQHKNWKEVACELDFPQRTVEKWAEESGIESRSYAHEMMFPSKTKAEIEEEYGRPLNEALFYELLKRAVIPLPRKPTKKHKKRGRGPRKMLATRIVDRKKKKALAKAPLSSKEGKEMPGKDLMEKRKETKIWTQYQEKRRKKLAQYHKKSRDKWTARQEETLKKMWAGGYTKKEMSRKVGHSIPTIYVKAKKLGLPMNVVKQSRLQLRPLEMLATKGIVKCHNCLEEIVLSKKGLDKDYKGGRIGDKTIFWHLPGKCTGDPSTHFNQLEHKRSRRGRPSEYERLGR